MLLSFRVANHKSIHNEQTRTRGRVSYPYQRRRVLFERAGDSRPSWRQRLPAYLTGSYVGIPQPTELGFGDMMRGRPLLTALTRGDWE
jgi:hypothetical protein